MGNAYLDPESRSAELWQRSRAVMPGGNSRTTVFAAPYPAYVASAQGATVTDVDGQTRLDFVNNYTSLIHGHAHPRILEAVMRQLPLGTAVSFPTESEIRLAELLVERVESLQRLRFTNSGTEAVMMAVQAARAFTGRPRIARFEGCYHGAYTDHADEDLILPFNAADAVEDAIERHASELAAVIVDPLPHRPGFVDPRPEFLQRLREVTRARDILLISDEIISFRVDAAGPQQRFGYAADLTTLGKIIGGGFPVGAFGGRADVMAVFDPTAAGPRVAHGGTFNANPVTMVAGFEAMRLLTPPDYDRLAALGERVRTGLADLLETRGIAWQVAGQASLFKLHPHPRAVFDYQSSLPSRDEQLLTERFYLAMLGEGIVLTPELAGCTSTPMAKTEVDALISAADRAFNTVLA
ncbi:MAG: aspartate aminotransferase family protein [Chloroflexi bacterium]|nr:aspartate aminotransferase family protein [Chloroflexota bacterium]